MFFLFKQLRIFDRFVYRLSYDVVFALYELRFEFVSSIGINILSTDFVGGYSADLSRCRTLRYPFSVHKLQLIVEFIHQLTIITWMPLLKI